MIKLIQFQVYSSVSQRILLSLQPHLSNMVRRLIASILMVAFTAQCFSQSLLVVNFYLNQKYISKNLCENRLKSSSCCHGKCFLRKQLNQQEQKNQESTGSKLENKTEAFNLRQISVLEIAQFHASPENFGVVISRKVYGGFPNSVFHPPCGL